MKAERAVFQESVFAGTVDMSRAVLQEMSLEDSDAMATAVAFGLILGQTVITRQFKLKNMLLQYIDAPSLQVEGLTTFERVCIAGNVDLQHSRFGVLHLSDVYLSKNRDITPLKLDGMTYKHISERPSARGLPTGQEQQCARDWDTLSDLLKKADYSSSAYANLEHFYRSQGDFDAANNVFIAQKRREREVLRQRAGWFNRLDVVSNYALDVLVRYGRKPARALWPCFAVVLIGWVVFRKQETMMLQDSSQTAEEDRYSPFWYSLDLFVPLIDLHAAEVWVPKTRPRWRFLYMRIHGILGRILVPIGLAALTGFIK